MFPLVKVIKPTPRHSHTREVDSKLKHLFYNVFVIEDQRLLRYRGYRTECNRTYPFKTYGQDLKLIFRCFQVLYLAYSNVESHNQINTAFNLDENDNVPTV